MAKQFKTYRDDDLYAGTPPLECLKLIVSHAMSGNSRKALMVNDVSRAYLHAPVRSETYVERCPEDMAGPTDTATCWKLKRAMYGTRSAAQDWQMAVRQALASMGFVA